MNPKGNNEQPNLPRKLKIEATTLEARLIQNPEIRLPRAEALAVDKEIAKMEEALKWQQQLPGDSQMGKTLARTIGEISNA